MYRNPARARLKAETKELQDCLTMTDLTGLDKLLLETYSDTGRKGTQPSNLLRALLVGAKLKKSEPELAEILKEPVYAVLCGFEPGKTPGVGTFNDFYKRLWGFAPLNFNGHIQPKPVTKKGRKNQKDEDIPEAVTTLLVRELLKRKPVEHKPFDTIVRFFTEAFVKVSCEKGLINPEKISAAGDGTPVVTSARNRSKHNCDCYENGIFKCDCPRYYSQPDCNVGWDSSRNCHFSGYNLYIYTEASSYNNLPLFAQPFKASEHDSVAMLTSYPYLRHYYPDFVFKNIILDSAHDAIDIYRFFISEKINPFIDLNLRGANPAADKDAGFTIVDGVPICPQKLKMKNWGICDDGIRRKFRCPLMSKNGCTCPNPCSSSPYGRCFYVHTSKDPRLFPPVPRDSPTWKKIYNSRTSSERTNKRLKIDYQLQLHKRRCSAFWFIDIYLIFMWLHIDAWMTDSKAA